MAVAGQKTVRTKSPRTRGPPRLRRLSACVSFFALVGCLQLNDSSAEGGDGKAWQKTAERLDVEGEAPEVGIDPAGNAAVVWTRRDGVWSRRYETRAGWRASDRIESATESLSAASLAVDANGNAVAAWSQFLTRDNIFSNRCTRGGVWGSSQIIDDSMGEPFAPEVAVSDDGRATAVWVQFDGLRDDVWSNRYTPTAGWQTPRRIETINASPAWGPQVAMDPDANAVAVWAALDEGTFRVWSSRESAEGQWSPATRVDAGDSGDALDPQVAIDTEGNALVVWKQSTGQRFDIWASRMEAGRTWSSPELIEAENRGDADDPHIAVRPDGSAVAVWSQSNGTRTDIWSNQYAPALGWAPNAERIDNNVGRGLEPRVAVDPQGEAVTVWRQRDEEAETFTIWAIRYTPSEGWTGAQRIDSSVGGSAIDARVALDRSGNAIAVWAVFGGVDQGVWSNRLE